LTDTPHRPIAAGLTAGLLLLAAVATMATRSPAIAPAPKVAAGPIVRVPAPALDPADAAPLRTAVFAGGCFWGVQGVFQHVDGVKSAISGYSGGTPGTAVYDMVGSGTTGHAESVQVNYDPRIVSYGTLLRIYFSVTTDPTELNRQGPDVGPSYRSAIFPQDTEQAKIARAYIAQLGTAKVYERPIVTRIEQGSFFPAEDYHQDFMRRNPGNRYITINDAPKVAALKRLFPNLYRG